MSLPEDMINWYGKLVTGTKLLYATLVHVQIVYLSVTKCTYLYNLDAVNVGYLYGHSLYFPLWMSFPPVPNLF